MHDREGGQCDRHARNEQLVPRLPGPVKPSNFETRRHCHLSWVLGAEAILLNQDFLSRIRSQWFGNIRGDVLAGLVVALALIPEAIAFSIIAGVDPKIGLYASFSTALVR